MVLIIVSSAQVAYRLTLPTEGWAYSDEDESPFLFTRNLLGAPSPLRPGDRLVAIEGVGGREFVGDRLPPPLADDWRSGQEVRYTVERDNAVVDAVVPLRHWTASAVLRNDLVSVRGVGRWLAALLMLGIGVFVLSKRPEEAPARALLLLSSVWFSSEISYVLPFGPTTALSRVMPLAAFFSYWIFGVLIGPTVLALALVFPRPKLLLRRIPWLIVLPYLPFWLLVAAFGLRPQIGFGATGLCFVIALLSVTHSAFTARDAVSRAQLLWGAGGFLAAIAMFLPAIFEGFIGTLLGFSLVPGVLGGISDVLAALAFPAFAACLAVAIVRHRLFDIDVIIRRTLVYTMLTLALVYFGGVALLQALSRSLTGGQAEQPQWAIVASTLAIAALFQPLRRRIQGFIDRRFYRRRYDAARTLAGFSSHLRDEVDLDRIGEELVAVVHETVQPQYASLWLRPPEARR